MQKQRFIESTQEGVEQVRISDKTEVPAPFFSPEIKGGEGLYALLQGREALDPNNPIVVPGYRWKDIRSKPEFKNIREELQSLIKEHPLLYYEPVELFRYTQPKNLVTYAFKGDVSQSREFYDNLREGEIDKAISMLPTFFQPFVEVQLERLLEKTDGADIPNRINTKKKKINEGWRDTRADRGYLDYFDEIVEDASRIPDTSIIPPVPPVLASSGKDSITRTIGVNRYMAGQCDNESKSFSSNDVYSYFHVYLDQRAISSGSDNDKKVLDAVRSELSDGPSYAGVSITISNYSRAWEDGKGTRIESFINDMTNIAREHHLPVFLPRSGYYGAHLTDDGVSGFSCLMNGNFQYSQRGSGIGKKAKYGTVPVYDAASDYGIDDLEDILKKNGGRLHPVSGLPDEAPVYNPNADEVKEKFGTARDFRREFGKVRRLVHVKEARELRESLKRGVPRPARRHLEGSEHPHLS
jgi:hypothetical protein